MNTVSKAKEILSLFLHKQSNLEQNLHTYEDLRPEGQNLVASSQRFQALRHNPQDILTQAYITLCREELPQEEGEASVSVAQQKAREIPEDIEVDRTIVWGASLLKDSAADVCDCCGRAEWRWKTSGQRVCSVCHPDPRRSEANNAT
jgi:hypothetical protein